MKIVMISGSWPPDRCGVGDYASLLCTHLSNAGADVIPFERASWSLAAALEYKKALRKIAPDIVHVHYPSVGYGRSLLPAMTGYLVPELPVVVTLHEFEIFRQYRWPWFYPYSRRARARIFSRSAERLAFAKRFPARKGHDHIVPIGSNIPAAENADRTSGSLVFFGLFWPGKGIEDFLQLAELLKAGGQARQLTILGAPVAGQEAFADHIRETSARLGIDLLENLPSDQVARRLAESEFAYLPYPEGADERRGTLAAAIVNGCTVLTPHKAQTPDWLKAATVCANSPDAAHDLLTGDLRDAVLRSGMAERAREAAQKYDWTEIARQHVDIYRAATR